MGPVFLTMKDKKAVMASYQYIYVMKGLSKAYPGGRQVL